MNSSIIIAAGMTGAEGRRYAQSKRLRLLGGRSGSSRRINPSALTATLHCTCLTFGRVFRPEVYSSFCTLQLALSFSPGRQVQNPRYFSIDHCLVCNRTEQPSLVDRYAFWKIGNARSRTTKRSLKSAKDKIRSMKEGVGEVLWGNGVFLRILGGVHNVIWLITPPAAGKYYFIRADTDVVADEHTVYAMLHVECGHHQALVFKGKEGDKGSFVMAEMPAIVNSTWNLWTLDSRLVYDNFWCDILFQRGPTRVVRGQTTRAQFSHGRQPMVPLREAAIASPFVLCKSAGTAAPASRVHPFIILVIFSPDKENTPAPTHKKHIKVYEFLKAMTYSETWQLTCRSPAPKVPWLQRKPTILASDDNRLHFLHETWAAGCVIAHATAHTAQMCP